MYFVITSYSIHYTKLYDEEPLENVSLVFTLSSGKEVLKSETFQIGSVEEGQELTKVLFWGLEEDYGRDCITSYNVCYTKLLRNRNSSIFLG